MIAVWLSSQTLGRTRCSSSNAAASTELIDAQQATFLPSLFRAPLLIPCKFLKRLSLHKVLFKPKVYK